MEGEAACVVGIDPGVGGAVAAYDRVAQRWSVHSTPVVPVKRGRTIRREYDLPEMVRLIRQLRPLQAVIEQQGPQPKQGVVAAFGTGAGYYAWQAILVACGVPYERVRPQVWKAQFGLQGQPKQMSVLRFVEQVPELGGTLVRVKHHNHAEAGLLVLWLLARERKEER